MLTYISEECLSYGPIQRRKNQILYFSVFLCALVRQTEHDGLHLLSALAGLCTFDLCLGVVG